MAKTNPTGVRINDRHIETVTLQSGDTVTPMQPDPDVPWIAPEARYHLQVEGGGDT